MEKSLELGEEIEPNQVQEIIVGSRVGDSILEELETVGNLVFKDIWTETLAVR